MKKNLEINEETNEIKNNVKKKKISIILISKIILGILGIPMLMGITGILLFITFLMFEGPSATSNIFLYFFALFFVCVPLSLIPVFFSLRLLIIPGVNLYQLNKLT